MVINFLGEAYPKTQMALSALHLEHGFAPSHLDFFSLHPVDEGLTCVPKPDCFRSSCRKGVCGEGRTVTRFAHSLPDTV